MKNNFKTSKCAIIAILTFCLLFCISGTQVFAAIVEATEDTPEATGDTTQELMPMMARGCSDYYYYYRGMDMDAVAAERGWSMNDNCIYQNGVEIGRYDDGSNGQDPHFHLYSTPGVHYILA